MDKLRKQLNEECSYLMKEETMDRFLGLMTEMGLRSGEPLIPYGKIDSNIYVVKQGIIRAAYFDGFKEMTFAFGLPGTVAISYYSYLKSEPSFCKYEACCDAVVMKVTRSRFDELLRHSHDFSQWMFYMSLEQLLFHERKLQVVNGDAKERFEALIDKRPEIIENVSSKVVASYIGVTPEYLSRLKKRFMPL